MKNIFQSVGNFDKKATEILGISQEILMENAASGVEKIIRKNLKKQSKILFLIGSGNNAADAVCVARKLQGDYFCEITELTNKQNNMLTFQKNIAKNCGVIFKKESNFSGFDCFVDGIFGSGFKGTLDEKITKIINQVNQIKALKIAIDIPTNDINVSFKADFSATMGALKNILFEDFLKDFVGKIKLINLGICETNFIKNANENFLLEKSDLKLPFRYKQNTNKGNFGHVYVMVGDMLGAAILAGLSASAIGAGLVSLVSKKELVLPPILMQKNSFLDAKVILAGCGFSDFKINFDEICDKKCVIDAGLLKDKNIKILLENCENLVITPHPKEFALLLKILDFGDFDVKEIQQNRFKFASLFSSKFKKPVLVLKGANTIVSQNGVSFVCDLGRSILAKGGSGDVLAGLIAGLLAQNYSPLQAATNAVLAHAIAANKIKNSYALDSLDLIKEIKCL